MEITKPILHTGVLKHEIGNISYSEAFLKSLAESKDVNIELNDHEGENIGKIKALEYKDNALHAVMDIPDEHVKEDIAFSTDIEPSKYKQIDLNTFEPTKGALKNVVFVNNGNPVRDIRTITRLQNLADKGDNDMADSEIAKELGALQTKYAQLQTENEKTKNQLATVEAERDQLKQDKADLEGQINDKDTKLGKYQKSVEAQKEEIIAELIEDEEDQLREVYKKRFKLSELKLMAKKKKANKSTPPKGIGTKTSKEERKKKEEDEEGEDKGGYNYLEAKKAMRV